MEHGRSVTMTTTTNPNNNIVNTTTDSDETQQYINHILNVLSKYKIQSSGPFDEDVSATVKRCFEVFLKDNLFQDEAAVQIEQFSLETKQKGLDASVDEIKKNFKLSKFGPKFDEFYIEKVILISTNSEKKEIADVLREILGFILMSWGFAEKTVLYFTKEAINRRYEDNTMASLGVTGWRKSLLPIWRKVVISHGIVSYCALRDTFTNYIDNYFTYGNKKVFVSKLVNPDYYARLGTACFDALTMHILKITSQQRKDFMFFVIKTQFSYEAPNANNGLFKSFLNLYERSKQPHNAERYIPGVSWAMFHNSSIRSATQRLKSPRGTLSAPHLTSSPSAEEKLLQQLPQNSLPPKKERTPSDFKKNLSWSRSVANNSDLPKLRMVFAEKATSFCSCLDQQIWHVLNGSRQNFRITNKSFIELAESRDRSIFGLSGSGSGEAKVPRGSVEEPPVLDCLILFGNAFGFLEPSLLEAFNYFGETVFDKIQSVIGQNFLGEMPTNTAFLIDALRINSKSKFRYIIYVCNRVASNSTNPFQSLWSALSVITTHNASIKESQHNNSTYRPGLFHSANIIESHHEPLPSSSPDNTPNGFKELSSRFKPIPIRTTVVTGICSGVKDYLRTAQAVSLFCLKVDKLQSLYSAPEDMDNFHQNIAFPENWEEASRWEESQQPSGFTPTPDQPLFSRSIFITMLERGEIERRGFIDSREIQMVCNLLTCTSPGEQPLPFQLAASRVIALYCFQRNDTEGIDIVYRLPGVMEVLLRMVTEGTTEIHNTIEEKNLSIQEKPIASGATGVVFKGKLFLESEEDMVDVAVKQMDESSIFFDMNTIKREIAVMSMMRHDNLVYCYGALFRKNSVSIVTEFISRGSLMDVLADEKTEISWNFRYAVALQVARGLEFLHSKNVIHRDIKSSNILIDKGDLVKLIDFGTSRILNAEAKKRGQMTGMLGTTSWMAPEVLNNEKYTFAADVYSFGIVLWELLTRKIPWHGVPNFNIPVAVVKGERPEIPKSGCPKEFATLIKSCWNGVPSKRPPFKELVTDLEKLCEEHHIYI